MPKDIRDPKLLERFYEIVEDISGDGDLPALSDVVAAFREKYPQSNWTAERAWLALHLARAMHGALEFHEGRIWALRSLIDGPRIDALCLLGELAFKEENYKEAIGWYEAACGMKHSPTYDGEVELPVYEIPNVVANRFKRLREIQDIVHPDRRPIHHGDIPRNHTLVVVTSPRPDPTIEDTIRSMVASGGDFWHGRRVLLSDGPLDRADAVRTLWKGEIIERPEPRGTIASFLDAVDQARDSDGLLTYVQDDVAFAFYALSMIERVQIPDGAAFVSWFGRQPAHWDVCWSFFAARFFKMAQAITLPPATRAKITADAVREFTERRQTRNGCDLMLGELLEGEQYAVHMPSLVQHVAGLNSSIGNEFRGERRSPSWTGADARTLPYLIPSY